LKNFLQYFGPLLAAVGIIPYVVDVVKGRTKPNVVSWVTWTLLTAIGAAAIIADSGFAESLLPLSGAICTGLIVLLGFKYGFAKYSKFDMACQVSALLGIVLWLVLDSALAALITVVIIDAIAVVPTILHAWKAPQEETWETFGVSFLGSFLTLLSVSIYTTTNLIYPIYLMLANATLATCIIVRRKQKGISLGREGKFEALHEDI